MSNLCYLTLIIGLSYLLKIFNLLNFKTENTIKDAVIDLQLAIKENKLKDSLSNPKYFNIKTVKD